MSDTEHTLELHGPEHSGWWLKTTEEGATFCTRSSRVMSDKSIYRLIRRLLNKAEYRELPFSIVASYRRDGIVSLTDPKLVPCLFVDIIM